MKTFLYHHSLLIDMNCSTLTDPANGQVSYTAGTTFGQTAIYSCNAGYNLMGDSTRICHATGVWSGSEPTCQGMLLLGFEYISSELHPKVQKYFNTEILQHRSREERTERVTAMEKFFERNCIRGYHIYKKVWTATVEEALVCKREPKNSSNQYAVAVKNEGTITEHLARKLSWVCSLFLRRRSTQSQV